MRQALFFINSNLASEFSITTPLVLAMAEPEFEHAFRVFSPYSHGMNSVSAFLPAAYAGDLSGEHEEVQPTSIAEFAQDLSSALDWEKSLPNCNTVFFTRSFLFALVYAGYKAAKGETDVMIVCINAGTAKTAKKDAVQFHSIDELISKFGVEVGSRKDGSPYGYPHELVVTAPVIAGRGSCYIAYSKLVSEGLYELYPVLDEVNKQTRKRGPQLHRIVEDLRRYWFRSEWRLTKPKLQIIAKLAAAFVNPFSGRKLHGSNDTARHLVAYLIAFQNRSPNDNALHKWVSNHSASYFTPVIDLTDEPVVIDLTGELEDIPTTPVPEFSQYQQLIKLFSDIHIPVGASAAIGVNEAALQIERQEWSLWRDEAHDGYQASRPGRHFRVEKKRRKPKSSNRQSRGAVSRPERLPQPKQRVAKARRSTRQPRTGASKSKKLSRN